MARLKKLYLGDRLLDLPHPFEEDVQFLVKATYDLLCDNIARKEQEEMADAENIEDSSEAGAERQWVRSNADELRQEARSIAVVTLASKRSDRNAAVPPMVSELGAVRHGPRKRLVDLLLKAVLLDYGLKSGYAQESLKTLRVSPLRGTPFEDAER